MVRSTRVSRCGSGGGDRRVCRARIVGVGVVAFVALVSTATVSSVAAAQQTAGQDEVRIVARLLANEKVEFGLQQRQADDSWGDRRLPRVRFFPADASVGRWLSSSPITVRIAAADAAARDVEVRIVARLLANGKVEFGLQQRQADDSWGDRRLPRVRFFPTGARVGRWLSSSPLTVTGARPAPTSTSPTSNEDFSLALTTCSGSSDGSVVRVDMRGTVTANRPVDIISLTARGEANGSFVGVDIESSRFFEAGESWEFAIQGIIVTSGSTLECDVDVDWTARTTTTTTTAATTTTGSSGGECYAGLVLRVGDRCTYPGTSVDFWVDSSGRGRFSFFTTGERISARNMTINGVTYNFVASKQSDGTWLIEVAG